MSCARAASDDPRKISENVSYVLGRMTFRVGFNSSTEISSNGTPRCAEPAARNLVPTCPRKAVKLILSSETARVANEIAESLPGSIPASVNTKQFVMNFRRFFMKISGDDGATRVAVEGCDDEAGENPFASAEKHSAIPLFPITVPVISFAARLRKHAPISSARLRCGRPYSFDRPIATHLFRKVSVWCRRCNARENSFPDCPTELNPLK
jgi:hypothetical protein